MASVVQNDYPVWKVLLVVWESKFEKSNEKNSFMYPNNLYLALYVS